MSNRDSLAVRAQQALRVVQDPMFIEAFDSSRQRIVDEMERLELDGDNDAHAASLVHKLQAAKSFKQEFLRVIQAGDREAQRAERDEKDAKIFDPNAPPNPNEGE